MSQVVIYGNQEIAKLPFIQSLSFGTELLKNIQFVILQYPVPDRLSDHFRLLFFSRLLPHLHLPLWQILDAIYSVR